MENNLIWRYDTENLESESLLHEEILLDYNGSFIVAHYNTDTENVDMVEGWYYYDPILQDWDLLCPKESSFVFEIVDDDEDGEEDLFSNSEDFIKEHDNYYETDHKDEDVDDFVSLGMDSDNDSSLFAPREDCFSEDPDDDDEYYDEDDDLDEEYDDDDDDDDDDEEEESRNYIDFDFDFDFALIKRFLILD